jgi:hypothetical protein
LTSQNKDIHSFWGIVVGLFSDLLIGGMLGVLIGFFIKKTGPKNYILKGIGISWSAWLLFIGIVLHNPQNGVFI